MNLGPVILEAVRLTKKIGKREVVKDVSFSVRAGEVFGFLGPNGAGKTTTIRMLTGLVRPSGGRVTVCGFDIRRDFLKAVRQIGCLIEYPEMYPYLTGWENLEHFQRMTPGIPKSRVGEVAEMTGLADRIHDRVSTYSLGMRQRLGIAQSLLGRPKILILDEPANGLDPFGMQEMRTFIRRLAAEEGMGVLISSHLLNEIQLVADRVAILSDGKIIHSGTVGELLARKEKVRWRISPLETGKRILKEEGVDLYEEDGFLIASHRPEKAHLFNEKLVKNGAQVFQIETKLPTLEDLFMELTGGTSR